MTTDYDVIIAGGGMAGASLASALAGAHISVAVLQASTPEFAASAYDDRGIALSLASMQIYDSLGLWESLSQHVTPIEHIHISEKDRLPKVRFSAAEQGLPALGYVVIAKALGAVLLKKVSELDNVDFISPAMSTAVSRYAGHVAVTFSVAGVEKTISSKLFVVADGADSSLARTLGITMQIKAYAQRAFVTNVMPEKPLKNTAYERFSEAGSVALLPSTQGRCVVIYVAMDNEADALMGSGVADLLEKVRQRFGKRVGELRQPGVVNSYPLTQMLAATQVQERVVLLGNAAHTIHPNAAQGFNLCLRDTAELADSIQQACQQGRDPGDRHVLQQYYHRRQQDQKRVIGLTERLPSLFYSRHPGKRFLRHSAMLAIETLPCLKEYVFKQCSGLAGRQAAAISHRLLN